MRTQRPAPPLDMTREESEIWEKIVDEMPPDFFTPDNAFVLRALVAGAAREPKDDKK